MFNIGEILKIDIVMTVTTQIIKNDDQMGSCVELVFDLVWNLYREVPRMYLFTYNLTYFFIIMCTLTVLLLMLNPNHAMLFTCTVIYAKNLDTW